MDHNEEERLLQVLDSVEKEEREQIHSLKNEKLTVRRQIFNDHSQDAIIIENKDGDKVDNIDKFQYNMDSEVDRKISPVPEVNMIIFL